MILLLLSHVDLLLFVCEKLLLVELSAYHLLLTRRLSEL